MTEREFSDGCRRELAARLGTRVETLAEKAARLEAETRASHGTTDRLGMRAWRVRNIDRALRETGMDPDEIEAGLQAIRDDHAHSLAELQRDAIRKTDDPVFYESEAGWLVDVIDPDVS